MAAGVGGARVGVGLGMVGADDGASSPMMARSTFGSVPGSFAMMPVTPTSLS
jgi:hypothetical protein